MAIRKLNPDYVPGGKQPKYIRTKSDEEYNARRRYRRAAERYAKQAGKATGAARRRFEALEREAIRKAESTYKKRPKKGAQVTETMRGKIGKEFQPTLQERARALQESEEALASAQNAQRLAQDLLRTENIRSRFYGGLVEIWRGRSDRNQAIYDFFGTDDMSLIMAYVETVAPEIYDMADDDSRVYDYAKLKLQRYVSRAMRDEAA